MAEEEHWLLPAFAACDAPEVACLLREHEQIRQKLLELGIGVDLHLTRAETVSAFVELLRNHARREGALAYRWAQRELPEAPRRLLTTRLAAAIRSLGAGFSTPNRLVMARRAHVSALFAAGLPDAVTGDERAHVSYAAWSSPDIKGEW
jgi:hypothetical protein